jgi:hypothetical protein
MKTILIFSNIFFFSLTLASYHKAHSQQEETSLLSRNSISTENIENRNSDTISFADKKREIQSSSSKNILKEAKLLKEVADEKNQKDAGYLMGLLIKDQCPNTQVLIPETFFKLEQDKKNIYKAFHNKNREKENVSLKDLRKFSGYSQPQGEAYIGFLEECQILLKQIWNPFNQRPSEDFLGEFNLEGISNHEISIYKILFFYLASVLNPKHKKNISDLELAYPVKVASREIKSLLAEVSLYHDGSFYLINSGYVWGGNIQSINSYQGSDCSAFVQFCLKSQVVRIITSMLTLIWKIQMGVADDGDLKKAEKMEEWSRMSILNSELIAIDTSKDLVKPGDIITIPGHTMIVLSTEGERLFQVIHSVRKEDKTLSGIEISFWNWVPENKNVWVLRAKSS